MKQMKKQPWLARLSLSLALLAGGAGMAQSLADWTPAGSVVAIGMWQDAESGQNLREQLASLDWAGALDTLQRTAEATGATEDFEMLMDMFMSPSVPDSVEFCPAAAELWSGDGYSALGSSALLSVGFSPFNPAPAVTMLAELNDSQDAQLRDLTTALLDCAATMPEVEVLELDQDGTPFWQVTVDYGTSFAFSHRDSILVLSSSADQLRYSLRLQAGSDEPSLADSRLHASWAATERGDGGVSWLVDYGVLADLVTVYGPALDADEIATALVAALRTAGGITGSLSQGPAGLVWENQLLPDRDGGDQELFDLLLAGGLTLPEPPLLPAGATAVASNVINAQAATDYLQGWLDRVSVLVGENLDLRQLLAEEGLDLDVMLLDWLGNDVHLVQLETSTASFSSLIRGPAQFTAVRTTDTAAAMSGVTSIVDYFTELSALTVEEGFDIGIDSRTGTYRGTEFLHVRVGPVTEFAMTTLGDYLVVGMPLSALHAAIDQSLDGGSTAHLPARPAGADVLAAFWLDGAAELHGLADLAELAVQPVAWAIHGGALSEASEPPFDYWDDMGGGSVQDWSADMSYGDHDVAGEELTPVAAGSVQTAQLPDSGAAFWLIEGVNAGDEFSVRMESENLDAMLELFELETGRMVAYNDDYDWMDGLHAQIDFVAREGVTYVARSASWGVSPGEEYALSVMVSADTAEAVTEETAEQVDVPPFGEFIDLVQLVPEFLRTVADGTGELEGFQERRGDTIYSRFVLHNNW